jgi:hypothetical protein
LTKHAGLRFDSAHAPANYPETIDHRCVRISADQRVGEENLRALTFHLQLLAQHSFREVLKIHLMHDADAWRNELESFECLLSPFQKLITFAVALELHVQIEFQRTSRTEEIDLHRVIDH